MFKLNFVCRQCNGCIEVDLFEDTLMAVLKWSVCVWCVFVYFVLLQTLIVFKLHFVCRHLDGCIVCAFVCVCEHLCVFVYFVSLQTL